MTSQLRKGLLTYALADIFTRFLNLLLYPLYSFFVLRAELGMVDLYVTLAQITTTMLTLQIGDAGYRWLIGGQDTSNSREQVVSTTLGLALLTTSIGAAAYLLGTAFFPWDDRMLFLTFVLTSAMTPVCMQLARGLKRTEVFFLGALVTSVCTFGGCMILFNWTTLGYRVPLVATIVANSVSCTLITLCLRLDRIVRWRLFDWQLARGMLHYSAPLVPNVLTWWFIGPMNAIFITALLGAEENGTYAMAGRFAIVLIVVNSVFALAWQDVFIGQSAGDDGSRHKSTFERFLIFEFSLCLFLTALSRPLLSLLIGDEYAEAYRYVPFLLVGAAFSGLCGFLGAGYLKTMRTRGAFTSNLLGAAVNLVFVPVSLPLIGLYGAGLGTALGFLAVFTIRFYANRGLFSLTDFPLKETVLFFLLQLSLSILIGLLDSVVSQCLVVAIMGCFCLCVNRGVLLSAIPRFSSRISPTKAL